MTATTLPSGIITFLFTDIQGSTPLWERDPDGMYISLERHKRILHEAIATNGGTVFKIVGDESQAAFVDPAAAVRATLAAQRGLATTSWATRRHITWKSSCASWDVNTAVGSSKIKSLASR